MRKLSDIVPTIVTATTINELKILSPALTRTFHKATKPFGTSLLPYNLSAKASPYKSRAKRSDMMPYMDINKMIIVMIKDTF